MKRKQERFLHALLILWGISSISVAQEETLETIRAKCALGESSCGDCIKAHSKCTWCSEVDEESTVPTLKKKRCKILEDNKLTCQGNTSDVITNPTSTFVITTNDDFTKAGQNFFDNETNINQPVTVIQMKPQNLTLKLRPGHPVTVNVTFHKVIDYPLDLYYVMDLSNSMKDDLQKLQGLGTKLFKDIEEKVTKNVRLGFGSFVDKVMMPFASTVEAQLKNPCVKQDATGSCAPAFGFRHQVNITSDSAVFAHAINTTKISGNIDSPEGSFDALMQIAVCEHIKWREGATHVILLTTDATPHFALDGKLAAILEAHDMSCHMERGYNTHYPDSLVYSKSKTMDYPSVGQLKKVFRENKIHSIFAVTEAVLELYEKIKPVLADSYVARLSDDSSNIIPLIAQTYNQLKGKLALSQPTVPDNVEMTYRVFCPNATGPKIGLECDNIEIGDSVVFEFTFKAKKCLSDTPSKQAIKLTSSSIQDEVIINIDYVCDCNCTTNIIANSSRCHHNGSLQCGLCACEPFRAGSLCQCSNVTESGTPVAEQCKWKDEYCGGHGICECGKCECEDTYVGTHCQCKTTGCPSNELGVCGGSERGSCLNCEDNRECQCRNGFTKKITDETCSCHTKFCKQNSDPALKEICTGRGTCPCDTCVCNNTKLYAGKLCETCIHPDCTGIPATCFGDVIKKCADCLNEKDRLGQRTDPCKEECANQYITFEYVKDFYNCDACTEGSTTPECTQCSKHSMLMRKPWTCSSAMVHVRCTFQYEVKWLISNEFIIYIKHFDSKRDCNNTSNPVAIALPVIFAIVIIGVAILLGWKFVRRWLDKRKYEQFQKTRNLPMIEKTRYKLSVTNTKNEGYSDELNHADTMSSANDIDRMHEL